VIPFVDIIIPIVDVAYLNIFAIVLVAEKVTVVSSVSMHQLETSETVEISKNICGNDRLNFLL